jgi:regulatory protein
LRLLARRDHSCSELSGKLVDRGFSQDQIQRAFGRCLRLGYLDDKRFAFAYVEQLQRKGYGCHRIRQMLVDKGVVYDIISDCLADLCCDTVQARDCRNAALKKLKNSRVSGDSPKVRAKLYRFLLNRGFPTAVVRQVLDEEMGSPIG